MLLNTAYKILTTLIRIRLSKYTEIIVGPYQQGFRKGKSTIDAIHILTQSIEKCYEYGIDLHILFIDFKQAFDGIKREQLINDMRKMEIPEKLIRLVKLTMRNSTAKVMTKDGMTNIIKLEKGVRQGDSLSTTLFNVALEGAIRNTGIKNTIAQSTAQIIAYADDIALIARSKKDMEKALLTIIKEAEIRGLVINREKTKYMISSRHGTDNITEIKVGEYTFQKIETFKYLGVTVNGKNERGVEINERIKAGNRLFWKYHALLKDKTLKKTTKIKIYQTLIRPVVTYAAETTCLTQKDEENLRIMERKILRRIVGPKKTQEGDYRILMNHELEKIINGENIVRYIKAQRLRWFGHIQRREQDALVKRITKWRPLRSRPRGRPKIRWEDQVLNDLKKMNITNWRDKVKDRKKWKEITFLAKTHHNL